MEQASLARRRRAGWYRPLAVAAAVAVALTGSACAGGPPGGRHQASAAVAAKNGRVPLLSCPARYAGTAPWVPAKPAGVNASSRLVPQTTPGSALICAYSGSDTATQRAGWALSGQRLLASGLARLADQLTWQPRTVPGQPVACGGIAGEQTNYLIGLTYPGGATIWVAATDDPNACIGMSNGDSTSSGQIGPDVTTAFASGQWPARPPVSCNQPGDIGRLGQDTVMVPAGSTSLTVCGPLARTFGSGYQTLVSALNRLPTRPSALSCSPSPPPSAPKYQLLFSYPEGPLVSVFIMSGCYPEIDNLGVASNSASTILPVIQQLLEPK